MESHRFPSRRDCPICSVLLGGGRTRLELHLPVGRISVRAETHHLTVFGGGGGDDVRSKWAGAGNGATIRTTRAMQVGPWIFVAIDTLVRSAKWDRVAWARGGYDNSYRSRDALAHRWVPRDLAHRTGIGGSLRLARISGALSSTGLSRHDRDDRCTSRTRYVRTANRRSLQPAT
jgi:hypothetical protein